MLYHITLKLLATLKLMNRRSSCRRCFGYALTVESTQLKPARHSRTHTQSHQHTTTHPSDGTHRGISRSYVLASFNSNRARAASIVSVSCHLRLFIVVVAGRVKVVGICDVGGSDTDGTATLRRTARQGTITRQQQFEVLVVAVHKVRKSNPEVDALYKEI